MDQDKRPKSIKVFVYQKNYGSDNFVDGAFLGFHGLLERRLNSSGKACSIDIYHTQTVSLVIGRAFIWNLFLLKFAFIKNDEQIETLHQIHGVDALQNGSEVGVG